MRHTNNPVSLSPEKMQLFLAGLSGLPPEEIRKAKSLYIRNAISEYKAMKESLAAFGFAQMLFWLIPIFWPMLFSQNRMIKAQQKLFKDRIQNALGVWKDDLAGEQFDIPSS